MTEEPSPGLGSSPASASGAEEVHEGFQFTKILRGASWYFLASLVAKGAAVVLVPIYTHYIPPGEYGVFGSLEAVARLLPFLISLGLDVAFIRFYYDERRTSPERVRQLYSTQFWFVCVWGVTVLLIGLAVSSTTLEPLLGVPFWPFVPLVFVAPLLGQLGTMGARVYRAEIRAREVSVINTVSFAVGATVSLVLLVGFDQGVLSLLWGNFVAGPLVMFATFGWVALRNQWLEFTFELRVLTRGLAFSIPLVPLIASNWINGLSDRLILAGYQDIAEVGLYTLSVQIALVLFMISDSVNQVQVPMAMSGLTADPTEGKQQVARFLGTFFWVVVGCYLALVFYSREIVEFALADSYATVWRLVGLLALAYVIQVVYRVFMNILSYHKKLWLAAAGAVLAAGLNVTLNLIFIPVYGQVAAAGTTVLSMAVYTAWTVWFAQRLDRMVVAWGVLAVTAALGAAAMGVYGALEVMQPGGRAWVIAVKTIVLALFGASLWMRILRPVREDVTETVRRGIRSAVSARGAGG